MADKAEGRVFRDLRYHVMACDEAGSFCGCEAAGAKAFRTELRKQIALRGLAKYAKVTIAHCGQPGAAGPVAVVYPDGVWYDGLTIDDVPRFIDEQFIAGRPLEDKLMQRELVVGQTAY